MIYLNDHIDGFDLEAALPLLSQPRREQTLRFKFLQGRKTCAMAYLLLCQGLREEYGITERPVFEYGEHGKPAIVGYPHIHFNISHCR
jgi:4'-phosphopantetheinyl transferase